MAGQIPPIVATSNMYRVDTLYKITEVYKDTGKLYVWDGACDNTQFSSDEMNLYFRGWHDYVHIQNKLEFDSTGEHRVLQIQQQQTRDYMEQAGYNQNVIDVCCLLLECEIDAQIKHKLEHGHFPEDQREFTKQFMKQKGYSL